MRIVSWNIRAGGGKREAEIAAQLLQWQPDLVGLAEFRGTPASQRLAERLGAAGLSHQLMTCLPDHPARNALLLASRFPLKPRPANAHLNANERWLLAEVTHPSAPFFVGVMHIPNRHTKRKYPFFEAVFELCRTWGEEPAILIGDTNSGIPKVDEQNATFNQQEAGFLNGLDKLGWVDGFRRKYPHQPAFSWYSPGYGNGFRLDQAFINRSMLPWLEDVAYVWGKPATAVHPPRRDALSDHAAMLIDFKLTNRA